MTAMRLGEDLFDVPVSNVAGVCLIKADLQLSAQTAIEHPVQIRLGDQNINVLGLVVDNVDRHAGMSAERPPLFISKSGIHGFDYTWHGGNSNGRFPRSPWAHPSQEWTRGLVVLTPWRRS